MSDDEIVEGCIKKNKLAQKELYDRFAKKMMGVCLRYCDNQEEGEDVLQNGFLYIFDKIDTYRGTGSLEGWIRKIIVNTALTSIRKNKKLEMNVDLNSVEYGIEDQSHLGENMAAKELFKIIQTLPVGFKTVFNLHAIEGYSHKEIAEMLGITEGTSKSQYSRAKTYLQKIIPL